MARIDYSALLSDEQKANILNARLQQFASEAFQHTLNREIAVSAGNEADVKAADDALTILDTAITVHKDELAKIGPTP